MVCLNNIRKQKLRRSIVCGTFVGQCAVVVCSFIIASNVFIHVTKGNHFDSLFPEIEYIQFLTIYWNNMDVKVSLVITLLLWQELNS